MTATSSPMRVHSGVPWWLWLMMAVVGGGVLIGSVVSLWPGNPEAEFQSGIAAFENAQREPLKQAIARLQGRTDFQSRHELLQALDLMGNSRPLKAIPLLESAAQDAAIKSKARMYLGQALSQGGEYLRAVDVLRDVVDGDKQPDPASGILATILRDLGAWNEALDRAKTMTESGGKKAAAAHSLRGDILKDLGRNEEAAAEFEKAIELDPVNPGNGSTTAKLLECLRYALKLKKAKSFLDRAESSPIKEGLRAECHFEETGDLDAAVKIIDPVMQGTSPGSVPDPLLQLTYAGLMVKKGKERAQEVLVRLRSAGWMLTRSSKFYRVALEVAKVAEQSEEAALYEQNLAALIELEKQLQEVRNSVIGNTTDAASRIKCGDLAADTGYLDQARLWYMAAEAIDPKMKDQVATKLQQLMVYRAEPVLLGKYKGAPPSQLEMGGPPVEQMTPPGSSATPKTTSPDAPKSPEGQPAGEPVKADPPADAKPVPENG